MFDLKQYLYLIKQHLYFHQKQYLYSTGKTHFPQNSAQFDDTATDAVS